MNKLYTALSLVLTLVFFMSCGSSEKKEQRFKAKNPVNTQGMDIVTTNCVACHAPRGSGSMRIAPPMAQVKKHYLNEDTSLEEFTEALTLYMNDPSEENSFMPGAIEKFGIMPKQNLSDEQLKDIAEYLFHTDLENDNKSRGRQNRRKQKASWKELDHEAEGLRYAMGTKAILGKNLMGQIKKNGTEKALGFCNEKAIHLTDSMAADMEVKIKRVSDKPRNPHNKAQIEELAVITKMKADLAAGKKAKPVTQDLPNSVIGYYPIETNAMCLQCHGDVKLDIEQGTLERIHDLYPEDKATGYGTEELRGIWVVEMEEKN